MIRHIAILAVLAALAGGCASVPFKEYERVEMSGLDPSAVVSDFADALPVRINLLNSLVFRYNFLYKLAAIGTIEMDTNSREFAVVGMSPLGMKLFEVRADDSGVLDSFVIPPLKERGDPVKVVARDIRRIYLDLVPSAEARVRQRKYAIEYEEPFKGGRMVYVFAGRGAFLVKKKYYQDDTLLWKVEYYEYMREAGRLYPAGIVLTNYKESYTLTAGIRKVYAAEQEQGRDGP